MLAALIRKELLALTRDLLGLGALFVMPAMFIVIMSLALRDYYSPPVARLAYALELREQTTLAQTFVERWQKQHGAAQAAPENRNEALRSGALRYVITLDPGFSETLASPSTPAGIRVRLVADPALDANFFRGLQGELAGLVGELRATAIHERFLGFVPEGAHAIERIVASERADTDAHHKGGGARPNAVQQNVPAWLVFGIFFVVTSIATLFVQEQRDGTLARLASMGVSTRLQIFSKALPYLGVNVIQAVVMLAVGVWLMPWLGGDALSLAGVDWAAFALMILCLGCAAVGFGLFLACLARTHAQANIFGPMCNILMAAIGGVMVPTFVMPEAMQRVAVLSPMHWGLEGLLSILLRHGGIVDVLPWAMLLSGFAAVMLGAAAFLFPRRIAA